MFKLSTYKNASFQAFDPQQHNFKVMTHRLQFRDFDPVRVGSIFCCSGQLFFVCVWVRKISPKYPIIFNFFPFESKKFSLGQVKSTLVKIGPASHLLRVKRMLGSDQVVTHMGIKPNKNPQS